MKQVEWVRVVILTQTRGFLLVQLNSRSFFKKYESNSTQNSQNVSQTREFQLSEFLLLQHCILTSQWRGYDSFFKSSDRYVYNKSCIFVTELLHFGHIWVTLVFEYTLDFRVKKSVKIDKIDFRLNVYFCLKICTPISAV